GAGEEKAKAAVERRARWLTIGLAAAVLLLGAVGGTVAWVVQQQQRAADAKAQAALDQVEDKVRQAREANYVAWLTEALADANRAVDIATGASPAVQQKAALLRQQVA